MNLVIKQNNDILNHCTINGVFTCQHYKIKQAFDKLHQYLIDKKITLDTIIEIGTYRGGFTLFIDNHKLSNKAKILSFDIDAKIGQYKIVNLVNNVEFYQENVFETDTVIKAIQKSKNCLILCDGGNKVNEFNLFSKHLKTNDIIMAHDFALTKETFDREIKGNVWDYFECSQEQVLNSIQNHKLKPILQDEFLKVAWGSYIKE
jgi:hypothetical protein